MSPDEVNAMFENHRQRGADFISFFLQPRGLTPGLGLDVYQFSFDPDMPTHSSDVLYHSTRAVIQDPRKP